MELRKLKTKDATMVKNALKDIIPEFRAMMDRIPKRPEEADAATLTRHHMDVGAIYIEFALNYCYDDVVELVASLMDLSVEEFGELDIETLPKALIELRDKEDIPGFFDLCMKLLPQTTT